MLTKKMADPNVILQNMLMGAGIMVIAPLIDLKDICKTIDGLLHNEISISRKDNPIVVFAIMQFLSECGNTQYVTVSDGNLNPVYRPGNAKYRISSDLTKALLPPDSDEKIGRVIITVTDDEINLYNFILTGCELNDLRKFLNLCYTKYVSITDRNIFFLQKETRWGFGEFRDKRILNPNIMTTAMRDVMNYVDEFKNPNTRIEHEISGKPLRLGIMLQGLPGTGKGLMVEAIGTKYKMQIYMLCLNSAEMTDNVLIGLLASVPENSIICIDELDSQLDTLLRNQNNKVSMGGLLSGLDGPQRLNSGVIVIVSSNQAGFLQNVQGKNYEKSFFRDGRIDKTFLFTEPFGAS